jgi:membrane associated rhomboid family serine protease
MIPIRDHLPRRRVPIVNYLLIALNVLVFVWERAQIALGYPAQQLLGEWGLVPVRVVQAPLDGAVTVFTSMFMHDPGTWHHIAGNMLFLWVFGDNVEDALGRGRYLAFYLLSGVAAAGAQILIDPGSPVTMVGASGAIAGVLAAYGSLYARSSITVLNPIPLLWLFFGFFLELPAWVVILEFFLVNLWFAFSSLGGPVGGVAFFAHLGGFVAGLVLVRFFVPRQGRRDHEPWRGFRPPPRGPLPTWHPVNDGGYAPKPPARPLGPPRRPWDD